MLGSYRWYQVNLRVILNSVDGDLSQEGFSEASVL